MKTEKETSRAEPVEKQLATPRLKRENATGKNVRKPLIERLGSGGYWGGASEYWDADRVHVVGKGHPC